MEVLAVLKLMQRSKQLNCKINQPIGEKGRHLAKPVAGVAGYTWVGVLHVLLGFSFKVTLLAANATSVAWILAYYLLLPPAVSKQPTASDLWQHPLPARK